MWNCTSSALEKALAACGAGPVRFARKLDRTDAPALHLQGILQPLAPASRSEAVSEAGAALASWDGGDGGARFVVVFQGPASLSLPLIALDAAAQHRRRPHRRQRVDPRRGAGAFARLGP